MSRRRPDDPPELPVVPLDVPPEDAVVELPELDDPVEYFVEVPSESDPCVISVPKSVHSSQTSSSAPSIFTRFGEAVSVPHISH
jgi:hypothetical protein